MKITKLLLNLINSRIDTYRKKKRVKTREREIKRVSEWEREKKKKTKKVSLEYIYFKYLHSGKII